MWPAPRSEHHFRRYLRLIDESKKLSHTGYTEVHHILPRAFGGGDSFSRKKGKSWSDVQRANAAKTHAKGRKIDASSRVGKKRGPYKNRGRSWEETMSPEQVATRKERARLHMQEINRKKHGAG